MGIGNWELKGVSGVNLGKGKGVHLDLFDHRCEAVRACGGEVLLEAYLVNELEVGSKDVLWRLTVEGAYQEADDAFGDDGIAVGTKPKEAVAVFAAEPYAALTAFDEVALGFVFLVNDGTFFPEVDDVGVFVEPFVEGGEFVDDVLFDFLDGHRGVFFWLDG